MKLLTAFGRFWWAFVVGDDWRIALGVSAALGASALIASRSIASWWLLPVAVLALLADSLRRATRSRRARA